jgi:hypothetical protein
VGDWRKLHNEELRNLYTSSNIIRVIKPRMVRWAGHVAYMEEMRRVYKILVGEPEGKNYSKVLSVIVRIILKCILGK